MKHRNTREGYEPENAEIIPDDVDPGLGISAGDRVSISEDHEIFPGEEGEVYAVARGTGWYGGALVIDVLIDGTSEPERLSYSMIGDVL